MKRYIKFQFALGIILLTLVFTNPSINQFDRFVKVDKNIFALESSARTNYFLFFSIYKWKGSCRSGNSEFNLVYDSNGTYIGVFNNFFEIK